MGHMVQRFGFRLTRGWAMLLLAAGAVIGAAFWIGPMRPFPAELQVLAFAGRQPQTGAVAVPALDTASGRMRFAVPLSVRNVGARAARAERLVLSVPAYYRLATRDGTLSGDVSPGVPLRRYAINLQPTQIPADSLIRALPGVDTLWVEPDLPSYYCTASSGVIPEFIPAPARNPDIISDLRIFYSLRTRRADERHAGLLEVRVDPSALKLNPAPMPPAFPTRFRTPEVEEPVLEGLRQVGTRTAYCGDPEQPMQLRTVLYETGNRGRLYVIQVHDAPRKRLYDLNRDSIIELETWDVDGDGRFDARREARFRVPEFLVPPPSRVPYALQPDSTTPDSIWLAVFHDAARGPLRFTQPLPARPVAVTTDAATEEAAEESPELRAAEAASAVVAPRDTASGRPPRAWMALFHDTLSGPFRFTNPAAAAAAAASAETAVAETPAPTAAVRRAPVNSADDAPRRRATQRRRSSQPLLGEPIPYPRPPGRRR